jgi:hypothetical protein
MATQSIPEFGFTVEKYALHNARPEPIDFMWSGHRFTIPPRDAVGPRPAKFEDGTPIPGTLVIQDAYTFATDGASIPTNGPPNWRAKEALKNVLGVNPSTQQAEGKLAKNGVSLIPTVCPKDQFETIKASGLSRYRESRIQWAMDTVASYEVARSKAKEAGVDPRPPGAEFYEAQTVLDTYRDDTRKKMGIEREAIKEEAQDDDLDFKAYAYAVAEKAAQAAAEANNVDKAKIVERMLEDPKVVAQIRKKYSWRKKGYLDPEAPGAEGAEQPEDSEGG